MKLTLASSRKSAVVFAGVAFLLVPVLWPASQRASADSGAYDLLYDPGPSHACSGRIVDDDPSKSDPAHVHTDGCGAFAAGREFQRDMGQPERTPTWDMGSLGWSNDAWGRSPGFSFSSQTASRTVSMKNNALDADCGVLHETNVSYTYQGSQLRYGSDRKKLTLDDGNVNVSYNAKVTQSGDFTCKGAKRAILTTDFIFDDVKNGRPAVLSVVHYDGKGAFAGRVTGDVLWKTLKAGGKTCDAGYGCRVMVKSPTGMLTDGRSALVGDDISGLFDKYASYLNPGKLPKSNFVLRGLQIVSSNSGSSTHSTVSDIGATLRPKRSVHTTLAYGDKRGTLCLDDTDNRRTAPADAEIWTCNGSTAQDWTIGLDNTLKVDGLCLDAEGGGTANGTNVILWGCNGGQNQKWVLGRYGQIYNPVSGRCLQVKDRSAARSGYTDLNLFDCWGGANQKWWTPYGDIHAQ